MSFRRGLTLFFVAIVGVPMIALAVLLVRIAEDSSAGKADARLEAGLATARSTYDAALARAPEQARRIAELAGAALLAGDRDQLSQLAASESAGPELASVTFLARGGTVLAAAGPRTALATAASDARSPGGRLLGTVRVAVLTVPGYLADVRRLTERDVALANGTKLVAASTDVGLEDLPEPGAEEAIDAELPGGPARAAALGLDGAEEGSRLVLFAPREEAGFVTSEPLVAAALGGFFAVAFFLIALLLRNLRRRIGSMLLAARQIGDGDFSAKVPAAGYDEMASLARELNRMSDRLNDQMGELSRQREELNVSVQRIGEAFASGLDRRALLETLIETATSACKAESGRVAFHEGTDRPELIATGATSLGLTSVLEQASGPSLGRKGRGSASDGDCHAIAHAMVDRSASDSVVCTLAVARRGDRFTSGERDVLSYLIGQIAVSIENIGLHERAAEQAVTDELTGIPNQRHFSDWIEREVDRIGRHGGDLSLVLFDIDDFKLVNDTHGHLRGNRVLMEIGRILRDQSRGMDEPARYGGEEFVLGLPETDIEGAMIVAERLRERIERTRIGGLDGEEPISVTVSLGLGVLPRDGLTPEALIAAADAALYRAKRAGKNRAEAAIAGEGSAQGKGPERRSR